MSIVNRFRRKLFGEILITDGLVTREQLETALAAQKGSGEFLGTILLELNYITESDIIRTLSLQYQIPFIRPSLYDVDRKLVKKFKPEFLHMHKLLPIDQMGNLLLLVVSDLPDEELIREIQQVVSANVALYLGFISDLDAALADLAPLSEADEGKIRELRKQERQASMAKKESAAPGAESAETDLALSLDTSWESIFDEAEDNVKGEG